MILKQFPTHIVFFGHESILFFLANIFSFFHLHVLTMKLNKHLRKNSALSLIPVCKILLQYDKDNPIQFLQASYL